MSEKKIISNVNYPQLNNNDDKKQSIIFKSSDYDLDTDERKTKYKGYDLILCEKCNQNINRDWLCKKCYQKETEKEQNRMIHGICKECFQIMKFRDGWCSPCNSKRFQQDFCKWTGNNKVVDELIQDSQI